ncbi:MAG: hypothetical protein RMJ28_03485 [Nitrososphaerota archaeon]|nr:hypothetical protein [Candidatus Calditenuaceae archaeon]MDW8073283.1 hypothetical protein [Nitrososphaerota archaeon]
MIRRDEMGFRELQGPSPIMPSDIERLVREVIMLKEEVRKIRKALESHGIKVE